jgi:hypothetical protein
MKNEKSDPQDPTQRVWEGRIILEWMFKTGDVRV